MPPGTTAPRATSDGPVPSCNNTARWSNTARVVDKENATSTGRVSSSTDIRATCPSSAAAVRADTGHAAVAGGAATGTGSAAGSGSGSSRTTCAFVPDTPNDDTADRRA